LLKRLLHALSGFSEFVIFNSALSMAILITVASAFPLAFMNRLSFASMTLDLNEVLSSA